MSHEVDTMAYAGEVPWHGLGKRVHHDLTPVQMMKEAGLDWEVGTFSPQYRVNGKWYTDHGRRVLVRKDRPEFVLSAVGRDWEPLQNADAFEFFCSMVAEGDAEMHTAGCLRGGKNVWVLAKLKKSFEMLGGDVTEPYLLFSSPHEYGRSVVIKLTLIRTVCWNTLSLGLAQKSSHEIRITHRKKFDPEEAKKLFGMADKYLNEYREKVQFLSSKTFEREKVIEFFKTVIPTRSKKDMHGQAKTMLECLETQPGADFGRGTWWQAFNAVTFVMDHRRSHEVDRPDKVAEEDRGTHLEESWFGWREQKKELALDLAMEYAEAA